MDEFSNIWIEQCEAARDIRDSWGPTKALGYLIGEKLLNYIRASDSDPSWAAKLPLFTAEIQRIFTTDELRTLLRDTHACRTGRPRCYRGTVSDVARRRRVRRRCSQRSS